jgi:hypothetical protein
MSASIARSSVSRVSLASLMQSLPLSGLRMLQSMRAVARRKNSRWSYQLWPVCMRVSSCASFCR